MNRRGSWRAAFSCETGPGFPHQDAAATRPWDTGSFRSGEDSRFLFHAISFPLLNS